MAIRYDSQTKAQIRKVVKSFNAKIRRLEAKGVSAALLPDKISSKEIQAGIANRRDLRKRMAQLSEFSSAGTVEKSEGGLLGTYILFQYRQGEANKAIQALNAEYNQIADLNLRYPMMAGEAQSNLRTKMEYLSRDIRKMDVRQINIFNRNLLSMEQRSIKDETFHANFQRMLFYSGYKGNIPPDLLRSISEKIDKLTPQELLNLYRTEPSIKMVVEGYMRSKAEAGEMDEAETKEVYEAVNNSITQYLLSI